MFTGKDVGAKDTILRQDRVCAGLALGCPTDAEPVVLDMSTSVVARGKIVLAEREGRRLPAGWAQDGQSTTSPTAAPMGALLPVGGPKGSGLSFFVDVLPGALLGSAVGLDVKGTFDMRAKGTKGDFLLALDPDFFGGRAIFLQSVMALLTQIRSASPVEGHEQVLAPGDLERRMREQRLRAGLPLDAALVEQLHRIPQEPRNRP